MKTKLTLLVVVPLLAANGSMERDDFAIYPEGLHELATEYLDGFERAIADDDEAGSAWLYSVHGSSRTGSSGPSDVLTPHKWAHLLAHDPEALGTAWGASEAVMYAELVEISDASAEESDRFDVGSALREHGWLTASLANGMLDAIADNLIEADEVREVAIPAARAALRDALALLDVDVAEGDELASGIDYLTTVDGHGEQWVWDAFGKYPASIENDPVEMQIVSVLTRDEEYGTQNAIEDASTYRWEYWKLVDTYRRGVENAAER